MKQLTILKELKFANLFVSKPKFFHFSMKKLVYIFFKPISNLFILLIFSVTILNSCNLFPIKYQYDEGETMGTFYHIKYKPLQKGSLKPQIDALLVGINNSLSTYIPSSTISKVNISADSVEIDSMFKIVFEKSKEIYLNTKGAFDPTVMPLVNAWGFGFKNIDSVDQNLIDSLMCFVGFDKVEMKGNWVYKDNPNTMLDFSAIAKGFGVDVVAGFLEKQGIQNYMVEIGGELRVKGVNDMGKKWKVGIEKPDEANRELESTLEITNVGMATSGNYRNFYYKDGKRFAHTIDPKSGYPIEHSILSASVITSDCMTADAYATSFMVMGVENSIELLKQHPEILVHFIYSKGKDSFGYYTSEKIEKNIIKITP